jgi:hypothetical protein
MTRMCRAQFENDDDAEAEIVCGRRETAFRQGDEILNNDSNVDESGLIQIKHRSPSMFTWKLPAWMNFSCSTQQQKPLHPQRRKPGSSGPRSQSSSRLGSQPHGVQQDDNLDSRMHMKYAFGPCHEPSVRSVSMGQGQPIDVSTERIEVSGPVLAHPSPIPWDDQTTVDLPYDNPFYTRTYDDVLWLPRNPCGILDLDDTVDLKVSLTTDAQAGQLGAWFDIPQTNSLHEIFPGKGRHSKLPRRQSNTTTSLPLVDGTEDIDLPPVIARRARSREDDIEQAVQPRLKRPSALYRGQTLGGDKVRINIGARSSADLNNLRRPCRSFSDGNDYENGHSASALNLSPRVHCTQSTDEITQEPSLCHIRPVIRKGTDSEIALPSRMQNVSARVAIAQEVVAEEEAALVDRIGDEQAEVYKATATKSWLTSWMFKKSE